MSFRFIRILTVSVSIAALLSIGALSANAQAQTAPAAQTSAPAPPTAPPAAVPAAATQPDYPDRRTFTIGLLYWFPDNTLGTQPAINTGKTAVDFEGLPNLGKPHNAPGVELSMPITRTGSIHVDGFLIKGTANQTATKTTDLFASGVPFYSGDYLATQYQVKDLRIYLDDLLFPHKFPVSRFRLKSLWGLEWVGVHSNVTTPLAASPVIADDSRSIVLPTFGIAAEYALAPHLLLRVSGAGFGIPHHAVIGEAEGELSYRRGSFEIVGGEKYLHFKSSPNKPSYLIGTFVGAFAGVRWHF